MSFQGILGIPGHLDVEPEQRTHQGLLMGCSALSNGPVGSAMSLSDVGGTGWVMGFSAKAFSGAQAEPSPLPSVS